MIDHVEYNAFGGVESETNPAAGDRLVGFAGLERSAATRLNLAARRAMDPATGTWISPDPIGFSAGDPNLGRYVGNAPTNATDPTGEWAWVAVGVAAGAVVGGVVGGGLAWREGCGWGQIALGAGIGAGYGAVAVGAATTGNPTLIAGAFGGGIGMGAGGLGLVPGGWKGGTVSGTLGGLAGGGLGNLAAGGLSLPGGVTIFVEEGVGRYILILAGGAVGGATNNGIGQLIALAQGTPFDWVSLGASAGIGAACGGIGELWAGSLSQRTTEQYGSYIITVAAGAGATAVETVWGELQKLGSLIP